MPNLLENIHEVKNENNWIINNQIMLFNGKARTMSEVREEQKNTVDIRCNKAFELAKDKTSVYWCHFNDEGDLLEKLDHDAIQIKGGDSLEKKEDILINFSKGNIKRLITKPKITSFGLNWQHCNHTVYFPTWSYEQYYQAIRRFWRFGQKNDVNVDLVVSDGQERVLDALRYKTKKAIEFNQTIQKAINKEINTNTNKEFKQTINKPKFL